MIIETASGLVKLDKVDSDYIEITAVSGSSSYYSAAAASAMADADAETVDVMTAVSGLFSC